MAKKFYAVKTGRVPGIYGTWAECQQQTNGFSGAVFKSFGTRQEAEAFIAQNGDGPEAAATGGAQCQIRQECVDRQGNSGRDAAALPCEDAAALSCEDAVDETQAAAYVDGSYDAATGAFSYGMVLFHNGQELHFSEKYTDSGLAQMHNVAGEIKGAEAAMRYCLDNNIPSVTIYHDYEGIARWCSGEWQAKKEGTIAYAAYYKKVSARVRIRFVKVKGHSGDTYNELADRLAKAALGIGAAP